jgi:hypothetical protein
VGSSTSTGVTYLKAVKAGFTSIASQNLLEILFKDTKAYTVITVVRLNYFPKNCL